MLAAVFQFLVCASLLIALLRLYRANLRLDISNSCTTLLKYTISSLFAGSNLVSIALGFGFAIAALAYSIGPISGGHMNPAVSFSFLLIGKLDPLSTIAYIVSQCLGAIVGAAALYLCVSNQTDICAGELDAGVLSSVSPNILPSNPFDLRV